MENKPEKPTFTAPLDNPDLDKAVDQIMNADSNRDLRGDDPTSNRFIPPKTKKSLKEKLKSVFSSWWQNKPLRYGTLSGLVVVLLGIMLLPPVRYFTLNTMGVRVSSSLTIVDSKTGLPLKNIPVSLQGQETRSNDEGQVSFGDLKLGAHELEIHKAGYADLDRKITLGWGSNPLGNVSIEATGAQFKFVLSDWMSGKTIMDGVASSGEDYARADDEGQIVLTVSELGDGTEATISAKGYRDESVVLSETSIDYEVKMVPSKKHVFVSNRDGKYDLYKIDVDGKNEEILVKATGSEREIPFVLPHQERNIAAYISSRDGEVNSSNFVLDGLYIVDVNTGVLERITRSEQLQIVGWIGDNLIYVAVVEGVSGGNSQRSKVFSYDVSTGDKKELASSNYFNDVKVVNDLVYYSVSSYAVPLSSAKLFSVDPEGENKATVVDTQVWTIIRQDFKTLLFNAANQEWYTQELGFAAEKLSEPPISTENRHYVLAPDGKKALWVDVRDGKGVLLKYDSDSEEDEILQTVPGLGDPVYWLSDNYVVYRVSTNEESADYVFNLDGGESFKIADVLDNQSRYFN